MQCFQTKRLGPPSVFILNWAAGALCFHRQPAGPGTAGSIPALLPAPAPRSRPSSEPGSASPQPHAPEERRSSPQSKGLRLSEQVAHSPVAHHLRSASTDENALPGPEAQAFRSGNKRPRQQDFRMSCQALPHRWAGSRTTACARSPLPTNLNKNLETIPRGHHSSVPAIGSGPRAVKPPASTSPHHSGRSARTHPSAFDTTRGLAPGAASA